MKKTVTFCLILCVCFALFTACGKNDQPQETESPYLSGLHHAEITIRDYGTIYVELDADAAPISVTNFVQLANKGFYDGLTFHRIMNGFMMQGGGFDEEGNRKSAAPIRGEFSENGVENPIKHERGVISMARATDPNSGSAQFFIMHVTNSSLDGRYAAFGHVTDGMDIVDEICENTPVTDNNGSVPLKYRPVIETVKVVD